MNVTMFRTSPDTGKSIFARNLPMMQRTGLKSAQDQAERQQKAQSQIAFWENQKESLKNRECDTLEDIVRKLDQFRSYESEIAAVKAQYNREQMRHTMDEAKEVGEKIAKEAEKLEPKTAEERREEMAKEALGTDENKGELTDSMEAIKEEILEEIPEEMVDRMDDTSQTMEEAAEETYDSLMEKIMESAEDAASAKVPADRAGALGNQVATYKRIDVFI